MVAAVDPLGGGIIASDAQPIMEYTKDVFFLEDGVGVEASAQGLEFFEFATDRALAPKPTRLDWTVEHMERGGYPHFMLKEIFEQPTALVDTLNATLDRANTDPFPLAKHKGSELLLAAEELVFVACGTSWHAALLGKYWIEKYARIPVSVELASEFRYRDPVLRPKTLVVGITQSGETADTLAVIRDMRKRGVPTAAITNVRGSSISREADGTFFTAAGPEVGVASTKAFMAQMATLISFAGARSKADPAAAEALFRNTIALPHALQTYLADEDGVAKQTKAVAKALDDAKGFFFIGRGYSFPMALSS
jgi:glucosamine--fructose-6-phosphate aminotransferase (isomerizing)